MSQMHEDEVAKRTRDIIKIRKRVGMPDSMFYGALADIALEFGVDNFLVVLPDSLKVSFRDWLPSHSDGDSIFIPPRPPETQKALRETYRLLKLRLSTIPPQEGNQE